VVDGEPMKLSLFDTTGHGAYDRLRPLDYPDTDLFVLCFSIINRRSFENILTKVKCLLFSAASQFSDKNVI